ncbi:MAG: prepilin-type N-terminal cleavage/methylation domain-containing protein [Rickettsiales bacterium]
MRVRYVKSDGSSAGMSLIELSITITIIGLLLAATLGGLSLVASAKIKKLTAELTSMEAAVREFKGSYRFYPGDAPEADKYWPGPCAKFGSGECNGNGNGSVEFTERGVAPTTAGEPYEDLMAPFHLSAAGLIPGSYGGRPTSSGRYSIGLDDPAKANAPNSDAFPQAGFMIHEEYDPAGAKTIYGTRGHTVRVGSIVTLSPSLSGMPYGGFIDAKQAFALDKKADDGKPASGRIYALREYDDLTNPDTPEGCVTKEWFTEDKDSVEYAMANTSKSCSLVLWLSKI